MDRVVNCSCKNMLDRHDRRKQKNDKSICKTDMFKNEKRIYAQLEKRKS